jgi:hypothetical protein
MKKPMLIVLGVRPCDVREGRLLPHLRVQPLRQIPGELGELPHHFNGRLHDARFKSERSSLTITPAAPIY